MGAVFFTTNMLSSTVPSSSVLQLNYS